MTIIEQNNGKKQQEHKIPQKTIEAIADKYMNGAVTNADIFEMTRDFQQSALDRNNTVLTNIGELYWHFIKIRDERLAA